MENDDDMRRIMEALSSSFHQPFGLETFTPDLFVPRGYQTKDFFKNMKVVVSLKRVLIYKRWENFYLKTCWNALSTHEMYIRYVMFACGIEMKFSRNIFDRIMNAFALVINFNIETLINSGVYFYELSVDMFMAFYKRSLKESFYRQGGFEQFSEYLRGHEYLPFDNYTYNDNSIIHLRQSFFKNLLINDKKEIEKVPYHPDLIKHSDIIEDTKCKSLAEEVLSTTKIKLPTLINSADLNARLQAAWKEKVALHAKVSNRQTTGIPTEGEAMGLDLKRESMAESSKCESLAESSKCKSLAASEKCESLAESAKCESLAESAKCESLAESAKCETTAAASSRIEMTIESSKLETTAAASSNRETKTTVFSDRERTDTVLIQKASEAVTMKKVLKETSTEASTKRVTTEKVLQRCINLKSDSQTNIVGENKTQLEWCENIIQRVIKYNNSKRPYPVNTNNQILKEADKILKRFNDTIESLIETLEDYD